MKKKEKIIVFALIIAIVLGFAIVFGVKSCSIGKIIPSSGKDMPEATGVTNEITNQNPVCEIFTNDEDSISQLAIVFNKVTEYEKTEDYAITISLYDGEETLASKSINVADIEDQHRTYVNLNKTYTGMAGKELKLVIEANDEYSGLLLMMQSNDTNTFQFGNMTINGTICFTLD